MIKLFKDWFKSDEKEMIEIEKAREKFEKKQDKKALKEYEEKLDKGLGLDKEWL